MKSVLITGVAGFIGSSLRSFIEERFPGCEVYGLDVSLKRSAKRIFKRDINDTKSLRNIIRKTAPHYIFHLAGTTARTDDFFKLFSENVLSTYRILEAASSLKVFRGRIVIPGSAAEYGKVSKREGPIKETHLLDPINFYGLSKVYQTLLALSYHRRGLKVMVGRIFNIIGAATPSSLSMGKFAREISLIEKGRKKPVIEVNDLSSERDYLDIRDVCSALTAIAERGKSGSVYNISSGRCYRTGDLLDRLRNMSLCHGKIRVKAGRRPFAEVKSISGSNKKIKKDTGWSPGITVSESLKNTLDYYRKHFQERLI